MTLYREYGTLDRCRFMLWGVTKLNSWEHIWKLAPCILAVTSRKKIIPIPREELYFQATAPQVVRPYLSLLNDYGRNAIEDIKKKKKTTNYHQQNTPQGSQMWWHMSITPAVRVTVNSETGKQNKINTQEVNQASRITLIQAIANSQTSGQRKEPSFRQYYRTDGFKKKKRGV